MKTGPTDRDVVGLSRPEAYLEGMKTAKTASSAWARFPPEAYLEGMKTYMRIPPVTNTPASSEAYLEGMKTNFIISGNSFTLFSPKPTSKE